MTNYQTFNSNNKYSKDKTNFNNIIDLKKIILDYVFLLCLFINIYIKIIKDIIVVRHYTILYLGDKFYILNGCKYINSIFIHFGLI